MAPGGLHVVALVKQIPSFEDMELGPDGRLRRDGVPLEMSAYCRRAVAQAVLLVRQHGGRCTVMTLGPPSAEDVLREALAGGADQGILVTDPVFAGSDTLVTAGVLAAAVERLGDVDVVLTGRSSVDADTGQVPPQVAQLLDLPFATGVRELTLDDRRRVVTVRCEHDDEWVTKRLGLPAVLSAAERLCDPCKRPPDARAAVPARRIHTWGSADLPGRPSGGRSSPTWVGGVRVVETSRSRERLEGPVVDQVARAVAVLESRGALDGGSDGTDRGVPVPPPVTRPERVIAVLVEPDRPRLARALLGGAASLGAQAFAAVVAVVAVRDGDPFPGGTSALAQTGDTGRVAAGILEGWGADRLVVLAGSEVEEDLASAVVAWVTSEPACWAILAPGTAWGREIASRVAAATGSGLIGDAVALEVSGGRLVAHKPAFGGATLAEIGCHSALQLVTVGAGALPVGSPRRDAAAVPLPGIPVEVRSVIPRGRVTILARQREDDTEVMVCAPVVLGLGQGVDPSRYGELDGLRRVLGAEFAATRKVTDQGWMPRARQLGITGHAIAPRLFVSLGASGKFNHTVGVRRAGTVLAVNPDPEAPIWDHADVGITARWEDAVPLLEARLVARGTSTHDVREART